MKSDIYITGSKRSNCRKSKKATKTGLANYESRDDLLGSSETQNQYVKTRVRKYVKKTRQ